MSTTTDVRTGHGRATIPVFPSVSEREQRATTSTTYTGDQALDYVRDTYSLRNPVERALAAEVEHLRELAHLGQVSAVEAGAEREAREHVEALARTVADLWGRLDPHTDTGGRRRAEATRILPHGLVAALDALTEV